MKTMFLMGAALASTIATPASAQLLGGGGGSGLTGTASGNASGTANGAIGNRSASASGSGQGALSLAGSSTSLPALHPGQTVRDAKGAAIGHIQSIRRGASGRVESVTMAVGKRVATLPADNFSVQGDVLVSAMGEAK